MERVPAERCNNIKTNTDVRSDYPNANDEPNTLRFPCFLSFHSQQIGFVSNFCLFFTLKSIAKFVPHKSYHIYKCSLVSIQPTSVKMRRSEINFTIPAIASRSKSLFRFQARKKYPFELVYSFFIIPFILPNFLCIGTLFDDGANHGNNIHHNKSCFQL